MEKILTNTGMLVVGFLLISDLITSLIESLINIFR